jgi:DnaK suppressor protein
LLQIYVEHGCIKLARTIIQSSNPIIGNFGNMIEPTQEASMNKSKSAPSTATKKNPASAPSETRRGKADASNTAPVAAKSGSDGTDGVQKGAGKSGTNVKQASDLEPVTSKTKSRTAPETIVASKLETRSSQAVKLSHAGKTEDEPADNIEKSAVSKVSEVATKTSKSTPTVSVDGALLSEAQILKMSDKDYMNAAQLAFFKARLQQLEKDLLKNAGETTEHLRETVLVPDPADRATIEEEHALELRTRDRERKLLKKVQQSIASIDSGEYGWCEETGEPIGIPRLLARPTATLSLEAQQRRELKQKLYGD